MDSATRYSAGIVTTDLHLTIAAIAIETVWTFPLSLTRSVQTESALQHKELTDHSKSSEISLRLVFPRLHSKNVIESRNGVIRFIYL